MIELHGIHVILSAIILGVMTAIWFAMDLWRDGNAGFKQEEKRIDRNRRRHQNRRRGDPGGQGPLRDTGSTRSASAQAGGLRRDPTQLGVGEFGEFHRATELDVQLGVEDLSGLSLFGVLIRVDGQLYSCSTITEDANDAVIAAAEICELCLRRSGIGPDECENVIYFGTPCDDETHDREESWLQDLQKRGVIALDLKGLVGRLVPSS